MIGAAVNTHLSARDRRDVFLEHQLDGVGDRLQDAVRADAHRPEPRLRPRDHLALEQHHVGDRRPASRSARSTIFSSGMTKRVDHPIDLAEHDVERSDQRDDVGDQVALDQPAAAPAGCRTTAAARGSGTGWSTCRR